MSRVETGTILDEIVVQTRATLTERKTRTPLGELEWQAAAQVPALSLYDCLTEPGISVIAEIKRGSPSRGLFPVEVDAARIAGEYVAGGAAGISVLTDEPFFRGSLEDLERVAAVAHQAHRPVAVLRKDFIVDPYQVAEARARGADAVLLIVAALSDEELSELLAFVGRCGMDALVEVHDELEMGRAAAVGARVIGINNRDLKTFSVDLSVTERLAPLAPSGAILVAESGVFGPAEVARLARAGANAVLVGEGLVTAPDRPEAVRKLRTWRE
jgi:indole-3-glycerol phosphate synthase